MSALRLLLTCLSAWLLGACASAPRPAATAYASERPLQTVKAERHWTVQRYVDAERLGASRSIALPAVRIAPGATGSAVSVEQAALVANRAARDLCARLARHYLLSPSGTPADMQIELQLSALVPTHRGAASASAVLGVFVPGPFRLPAGMGGLAMDAAVRDASGSELLVERWSRGANAVMDDASISTIGDAYQLAGSYARELAAVLAEPTPGQRRQPLAREAIRAGRELCTETYGSANLAGRGASWLLPLAPESIDSGKPAAD